MKKTMLILLILTAISLLTAEETINLLEPNDLLSLEIKPEKNANLAMIMSAIVPGSGQFYVSRNTFTAYLFPVIEIGLWTLKYYLKNNGDLVKKDYERFANKFYDMDNQYKVQRNLIDNPNSGKFYGDRETQDLDFWGNGGHFRLKKDDMQHYYEDIGKYSQYTFGWADWYETYVVDIDDINVHVEWIFNGETDPYKIRWIGNRPINDPSQEHIMKEIPFDGSELRDIYINMRMVSEDYYRHSDYMNFVILANHVAAAIDARFVAKKHNQNRKQTPAFTSYMTTKIIDNKPTPALGMSYKF